MTNMTGIRRWIIVSIVVLGTLLSLWLLDSDTGYAQDTSSDSAEASADVFPDLGDAPDSTNNHGNVPNTAYADTAVPGRFPTVRTGPMPGGPRHMNATAEGFLGDTITREGEADQGPDADSVNNILDAGADVSDADKGDDGWLNSSVPLVDCRRATLRVRVSRPTAATLETMYLNVWFDGSRDGDWEDTAICTLESGQQLRAYEWIVQDKPIDMTLIPPGGYVDIPVTTLAVHNQDVTKDHWLRFTLSERQAPRNPATGLADGRGPAPGGTIGDYRFGETEDFHQYLRPDGSVQPGDLVLTKELIGSTPVPYAESRTYRIRLANHGGAPVEAEIRDEIPYPQHVLLVDNGAGPTYIAVSELSPGVSPLSADLDYDLSNGPTVTQIVRWRGTLGAGAEIELTFDVHVHPLCATGENSVEIVNTAEARARTLDGAVLATDRQASTSFQALCPGVTLDDIVLRQTVLSDAQSFSAPRAAGGSEAALYFEDSVRTAREKSIVATEITNNGPAPASAGFFVEVSGIGSEHESAQVAAQTAPCRIVSIAPGQTISVTTPIDLVALLDNDMRLGQVREDSDTDLAFRSTAYVQLIPADTTTCHIDKAMPGLVKTFTHDFDLRPYDVGDAPDSTNHAGVAMDAYTGVPAAFDTVFDPATGLPQGPAHARPRPFHLGQAVEIEVDADLAPAPRNITPPAPPNRDGFDDGAQPSTWTLNHCRATTIPIRVFISPQAAAWFAQTDRTGYLNVWLDGNRDGDWTDGGKCTDEAGNEKVALEHIVIDEPVDVAALGAGLHTLGVTTRAVPWPASLAEKDSWVRVTLSEQVSNKPLTTEGITHGDGRGYDRPFRTGETEDYLLRPKGSQAHGAALAVDTWSQIMPYYGDLDVSTAGIAGAANLDGYRKIVLGISVESSGDEPVENVTLSITLPNFPEAAMGRAVGSHNLSLKRGLVSLPELATALQNIVVDDLEPGEELSILVIIVTPTGATAQSASVAADTYQFEVAATAANAESIQGTEVSVLDRSSPLILGVRSANAGYLSQAGATTCSDTVDVFGSAEPGTEVTVHLIPALGDIAVQQVVVGDYNNDGLVDASDYNLWRDAGFLPTLQGDFNGDGVVNAADYTVWRSHFGSLPAGQYEIHACRSDDGDCLLAAGAFAAGAEAPDATAKYRKRRVTLDVAPALSIDPSSLVYTGTAAIVPPTQGWEIINAWPKLKPGDTYLLSAATCDTEVVGGHFTYNDTGASVEVPMLSYKGWLTAPLTIPVVAPIAAEAFDRVTLSVFAGGSANDLHFVAPLAPEYREGAVLDGAGNPVEGAEVLLLLDDTDGSEQLRSPSFSPWQGPAYGQPNPQTTAADGKFVFYVQPGSYRLLVRKAGYSPFLSRSVDLMSPTWLARDVRLTKLYPELDDELVLDLAITDAGFEPPIVELPLRRFMTDTLPALQLGPAADHREAPLIRLTNLDATEHVVRLTMQLPGAAAATSGQSGSLAPGDSYVLEMSPVEGAVISLSDPTDPTVQGSLILVEPEPGGVMLPFIVR